MVQQQFIFWTRNHWEKSVRSGGCNLKITSILRYSTFLVRHSIFNWRLLALKWLRFVLYNFFVLYPVRVHDENGPVEKLNELEIY